MKSLIKCEFNYQLFSSNKTGSCLFILTKQAAESKTHQNCTVIRERRHKFEKPHDIKTAVRGFSLYNSSKNCSSQCNLIANLLEHRNCFQPPHFTHNCCSQRISDTQMLLEQNVVTVPPFSGANQICFLVVVSWW